jgi:hypothetical protein
MPLTSIMNWSPENSASVAVKNPPFGSVMTALRFVPGVPGAARAFAVPEGKIGPFVPKAKAGTSNGLPTVGNLALYHWFVTIVSACAGIEITPSAAAARAGATNAVKKRTLLITHLFQTDLSAGDT